MPFVVERAASVLNEHSRLTGICGLGGQIVLHPPGNFWARLLRVTSRAPFPSSTITSVVTLSTQLHPSGDEVRKQWEPRYKWRQRKPHQHRHHRRNANLTPLNSLPRCSKLTAM